MHKPKISVVIASVNGLPSIAECLSALDRQWDDSGTEVVVVDCCKDGTADYLRKHFPRVKLLPVPERLGIPELRAIGMFEAAGDIIVILEDHCIVGGDWLAEILKAHESGEVVVGGAVENGSVDRIVDWAAFLCEYSHTMPPIPYGAVENVTGNNVSYRREILDGVSESVKKYFWDFFLHEELKKANVRFFSAPTIIVHHKKEFGFLYFLSQRFHYSRSFAGMRKARMSTLKRLCHISFSPLLPLLMIWRIAREVFLRKKRHRREFLASLPLLAIFMVIYAYGELVGYLFGPGKSLVKVE